MKSPLLAKKYARALFEASKGKADLKAVAEKLPAIAAIFARPSLSYAQLVKALGAEPDQSEVQNLLKVVCRRKRHKFLPEIVEAYTLEAEQAVGIHRAEVTTATKAEPAALERMKALVTRLTRAQSVKLDVKERPDMIGGVVIRIGDNLIDGSVKSRLEEFRSRF